MSLFPHWPSSHSMGQSTAFQIANSGGPIFETADASLTLASGDGSQTSAPAPFLTKTYDMVDDSGTDSVVSWSTLGNSFVVWNHPEFSRDLLPKYFKHNNFSSFVRQLNTYGFRKVDPEKWEFANEGFLRGKRQLLKNIHRRKPASHNHPQPHQGQGSVGACVEVGKFGLEQEVERLKRDKSVLMMELVRLRQQQQQTERELQLMGQRFHIREQSQQKMISFFARALKNPSFFAKLVEQNEQLSTSRKKRKFSTSEENESESSQPESSTGFEMVRYQPNANGTARSMYSKILNSTDDASKIDKLDPMIKNFEHREAESRLESDESPQSGVSLTETLTSTSLAEVAPVCKLNDFSIESRLFNSPKTESKASTLIPDNLETGGFIEFIELSLATREGPSNLSSKSGSTDKVSNSEDATAFASNAVVRSGVNDVFWEKFLTGSPGPSPGPDNPETKVDANTSVVSEG